MSAQGPTDDPPPPPPHLLELAALGRLLLELVERSRAHSVYICEKHTGSGQFWAVQVHGDDGVKIRGQSHMSLGSAMERALHKLLGGRDEPPAPRQHGSRV